ncbi:MAG: O-antigen ligase family protein, partial [bacterium]
GSYIAPLMLLLVPTIAGSRFLRPSTLAAIVSLLILLVTLVLTAARGAWIGFVVGFAFLILVEAPRRSPRWRRGLLVATLASFAGLISIMAIFSFPNPINRHDAQVLQRFGQLFDLRSNSVKERIFFYNIAAKIIGDAPWLGRGPGTFRMAFYPTLVELEGEEPRAAVKHFATTLQSRVAYQVHNDWLEFWVEGGTLGLAALALLLAVSVRLIADACKILPHDSLQSRELRAFAAALLCLLTSSLFNFSLHLPNRALLFWACLGAAAGTAERSLLTSAEVPTRDNAHRPGDNS